MIVLKTIWLGIQIVILLAMALIAALPIFIIYLILNQINYATDDTGDILHRTNQLN
jgi:hypothetical protein